MATFNKHRGVFVDVACVVFVGLLVACFSLFAKPFDRGFFCDDDTIRYPLVPSTISTLFLAVVCFGAPLIVFLGVEGVRLFETSTPRDSWHSVSTSLLKSIYQVFGVFVFGSGLNQVTVDVAKYTVGRLRPHFLQACKPGVDLCSSAADQHTYVTALSCTGDQAVVDEARLSFPSGHAALSFYAAVYVAMFLQHRLYWRSARLPRHLAQATVLIVAWFCALTRVQDNMHHPTDVAAGCVIGTIWALLMTCFVIDLRLDSNHVTKEELRSLRGPAQGGNNV